MEKQWSDKLSKVKKQLDEVSPSFCLAKWLQVTINLESGFNHSCHHPTPHKVSIEEIKKDPSALHNSRLKKQFRGQMLDGQRPSECDYCWKVEDTKGDHFSDRPIKSSDDWALARLDEVVRLPYDQNIAPSYLEVMFSSTCNFKCAYCAPHISSSIMSDVKKHGHYGPGHWTVEQLKENEMYPIKKEEDNEYIKAFWQWFPNIYDQLRVLRVTGGEPLLSPNTFKLFDYILKNENTNLEVAINSNLNISKPILDKTKDYLKRIVAKNNLKKFSIYTSCDTHGKQAEYIRNGMNYQTLIDNIKSYLEEVPEVEIVVMCTFNFYSLPNFKLFLEDILDLKKRYSTKDKQRVILDTSILSYPKSLSALLAPKKLKQSFIDSVSYVKENIITQSNPIGFSEFEINKIVRLFNFLNEQTNLEELLMDGKDWYFYLYMNFLENDYRKGTDFEKDFPQYKTFFQKLKTMSDAGYKQDQDYLQFIRDKSHDLWRNSTPKKVQRGTDE